MANRRERWRQRRSELIEIRFLEGVRRRCPREALVLKALGDSYTRVGRCADGLAIDLSLTVLCPGDAVVWYNLACSYARLRRRGDAFDALKQAIALGYDDAEWMQRDDDLRSIAGDARFRELVDRIAQRNARPA